ncbi:MICOS complex subunit mic60 [Paecilomyces lecythidis]|uniref:MICOS complex subunit MIC60 n=1 Tax=Paecilomyces lecythidis TaxID=3004212 RepID=A0ABR3YEN5_9EURO
MAAQNWCEQPDLRPETLTTRSIAQRYFADPAHQPPITPTPATPSSDTTIPPENIPKVPPTPATQGQRSLPSTVQPPEYPTKTPVENTTPPPPPPPARKKGGFRRFLLYLILTSGLAYGGGVALALKSDNFHDFFTEYIPYGEEAVLYFEERDFYRRFPNATRHPNRLPPIERESGNKVTIPSKSGLSWKVAEQEASDATNAEKKTPVQKAKDEASSKKPATQDAPKEDSRKPAVSSVSTLELLNVKEGDEPIVQELVKTFNDIITVISADEAAGKYSAPIEKAKNELHNIGEKITALRTDAQRAAEEQVKKAHEEFEESAKELIRRIDEARAAEAAQYREEFESEREKLAHSYQEKLNTELQRAQEVSEQRLRNELVEQAIELNRKYLNDVKELVEREREGRLSKLSELTASVNQLEKLTTDWSDVIDINLKTQQLQVAVDAVRSALERPDMPRPFVRELVAVKELAADDPVVSAAIASINPAAYQRGIPSSAQIVDRFRRVANEVRKASLLPENAGIASHAASLVLSKVMFKKEGVATGDDVESVLTRTEHLLEEGNLDAAAREMNSLQGWAKILSKDWLADVRRVLEVRQALEVIETEARLQCLRVES